MVEHPNAVLARRGYNAFAAGDLDTLRDIFAPEVTWHQPHTGVIAGDYTGLDQVLAFFAKLAELTAGTYRAEPVDILADNERAVAIQHSTAVRDGTSLDTQQVLVFEMKDGRVTEIRLYPSDEKSEDSFWS
jgi:ketosteroid isomerase-like protein